MKIILVLFFPLKIDVTSNFLQTIVKVAYQNEIIICIFFYITQMSLTWIIGLLTAYAFLIGERRDGRECGRERYWPVGFITRVQCVMFRSDTDL
jgi:hypothetical protein